MVTLCLGFGVVIVTIFVCMLCNNVLFRCYFWFRVITLDGILMFDASDSATCRIGFGLGVVNVFSLICGYAFCWVRY